MKTKEQLEEAIFDWMMKRGAVYDGDFCEFIDFLYDLLEETYYNGYYNG